MHRVLLDGVADLPSAITQLNEGLSSEYIKNRKTEDGDVDESTAKFDADRQVNSKYFVNQILQQGEEGLRDAWSKVRMHAQHMQWKRAAEQDSPAHPTQQQLL